MVNVRKKMLAVVKPRKRGTELELACDSAERWTPRRQSIITITIQTYKDWLLQFQEPLTQPWHRGRHAGLQPEALVWPSLWLVVAEEPSAAPRAWTPVEVCPGCFFHQPVFLGGTHQLPDSDHHPGIIHRSLGPTISGRCKNTHAP